jgi:hypothetical protein
MRAATHDGMIRSFIHFVVVCAPHLCKSAQFAQ